MHQPAILGLVRVALGAEAYHARVLFIRHYADYAVGRDGVFVEHEGYRLTLFYGVWVYLFNINQGTGVVCRLHGAGQHGEYLQPDDPCAHKQKG